jgi:hypothetical protein
MPGLIRGVARTAVIAGTATTVSNRVSRRQARRWSAQEPAYAEPQPNYPPPPPQPAYQPPPPAAPAEDPVAQLKKFAELRDAGILTEEEFAAEKAKILNSM